MKKSRLLLLISALLVLTMVLSSCGNVVSNMGKFLNEDYDPDVDVYGKANNIAELEGYSINPVASNDTFVVFYSIDTTNGVVKTSYKLLSMYSGTVVATFVSDQDNRYEFLQHDDYATPSIIVKRINLNPVGVDMTVVTDLVLAINDFRAGEGISNLLDDYLTTTYSLYDPTGAEVAVTKYQPEQPASFGEYAVYDGVAYTVNEETGAWTKAMEIPEYVELKGYLTYNDDYYYVADNSILTVYDRDFKLVSNYVAPAYGDHSVVSVGELVDGLFVAGDFLVLNDGNILYQYGVIQDDDAKKYDVSYVTDDGTTLKVNLVSLLISAKKGEAKELNLDYVVANVLANNNLYDEELDTEENVFNQEFENIAFIAYIEDGKILSSREQMDIVLMNNKAKAGKSLKLVEGQSPTIPQKIDDDLYSVYMLNGGIALVNGKGKIQNMINNPMDQIGAYFIGNDAIYTLSLEKVQDLKDPDVSYKIMGESIFVTKRTDSKTFSVELLRDGETKTVYSQNKDSKTRFQWGMTVADLGDDGVEYYYHDYYYIVNEAGDYTYYNEEGEQLVVTKRLLTPTAYESEENCVFVLTGVPNDPLTEKVVYYVFIK